MAGVLFILCINIFRKRHNELIATDSITFTKFLTAVAARTGELLNYANIASDIGISEMTVKNGYQF